MELKKLIERLQFFLEHKGDLHVVMRLSEDGGVSSIVSMFDATVDKINGRQCGEQVVVLAGYVPKEFQRKKN